MNLRKLCYLPLLALLVFACEDDEQNIVDGLFENVERGAILRTVETEANSIPIAIENGVTTTAEGAGLKLLLEEQDPESGNLLESIDVFINFTDGSADEGDSTAAVATEVFLKNIPASEFTTGPFGLPRTTLDIPASEMLAAVNLTAENIFGGDNFVTRIALKLTDGRVFSTNNAGGIITGGFFESPFQYSTPVVCNLPEDAFVGEYLLEEITPYVDGPTFNDGSVVTVSIGDTATERFFATDNYPDYCAGSPNDFVFQFVCGEIVIPSQASVCACGDGSGFFAAAEEVANYDVADDSVFLITFLNDAQSNCASPEITTYQLTKQ